MDNTKTPREMLARMQASQGKVKIFALPIFVAVMLIAATTALSAALYQREVDHIQEALKADANTLAGRLQADINARVSALHRLAGRWSAHQGLEKADFLSDSQLVFADFPGFQALQWIDSELTVRWIEPLAGNEVALGIKSAFEPRRLAALERSRSERVPTMTSAINLLQGGKGFLLYVPLYKRNEFDGFLLAVFRLDDWLHHALLMEQDQALGHHMHLDFNKETVYRTVGHSKSHEHEEVVSYVSMFGHELKLIIWPTDAFKASEHSGLPFIVGLFGIAISILTGLVLSLWSRSEAAAVDARRHQQRLKREVAERKAAQEQLHKLAYYDALTGLASRRLAMDRLNMSVRLAREQESMMAILYIDIDGFKNINDTWGHEIGDQLLCKVGDLISEAVRDVDTVARLGGDEFLVVLADLSQQQDAEVVAERIRDSITKVREIYNNAKPVKLNTAVSVGIAIYPGDGTSVAALLAQADAAMYESKKAGRNRCTLASNL